MHYRLLFIFLLLNALTLSGQNVDIEIDSTNVKYVKLKPLSKLLDAAMLNAPDMRSMRLDSIQQTLKLKLARRSWADLIGASGSVAYGNGLGVTSASSGTADPTIGFSNSRTLGLGIGVSLRIPGGEVMNRHIKTQIAVIVKEKSMLELDRNQQKLREEITTAYMQLELAFRKLPHRLQALEGQRMVLFMAEREFKAGNMTPAEYSAMLIQLASLEESYLDSQFNIQTIARNLKVITGVSVWENNSSKRR